jgi:lipopolysaccharide heptosyltransferase I
MSAFLIVRLGALGDILHAVPLAAALRARFPKASIDWLVEERHAALVGLVTPVSRVVPIVTRHVVRGDGWLPSLHALRKEGYEVAFDAQGLVKSAALARLSGARRTVGFAGPHLRERAARVFYSDTVDPGGARHVVAKNLALLRAVGIDAPAPEFPLDPGEPGEDVVITLSRASAQGAGFVLLNPGGGWPNKRWPPDRFGELAAAILANYGLPAVVLWGPGDEALAGEVVAASRGAARLAPPTTLPDVLHLARAARLVVSGDTGPMHLAASVGAPIVAIHGPTDPARNGPWSPDDVCVTRHTVCECSHLRRCRAAHWCLDEVTPAEVLAAVDERLSRAAAAHADA